MTTSSDPAAAAAAPATPSFAPDLAPVGGRIFHMAWPNVLYAFLDALLGLVDGALVSKLGANAISAVGLSQQLLFIVLVVAIAVPSGAVPFVGQAWARGDVDRVARIARQVIISMIGLGALLSIVYWFIAAPGLRAMNASPAIVADGVTYIHVLAPGLIVMLLNFALVSLFRGIGQVRTPLVLAVVVNLVHVVASYVLLVGVPGLVPAFGLGGAAAGTLIARLLGTIILLVLWHRAMRRAGASLLPSWRFDWPTLAPVMRIGSAIGGMQILRVLAQIVFFAILTAAATRLHDDAALAAGLIVYRFRFLFIMASLSIQISLVTLVSHSLGRSDFALAKRFTHRTLAYGLAFVGGLTLLLVLASGPAMRGAALLADQHVTAELVLVGEPMLRIVMAGQLFTTASIILGGALFGGGDAKLPFLFTLFTEWCIMLPTAWWITHHTHLPLAWIWSATVASGVVMCALIIWRYNQGKWLHRL